MLLTQWKLYSFQKQIGIQPFQNAKRHLYFVIYENFLKIMLTVLNKYVNKYSDIYFL